MYLLFTEEGNFVGIINNELTRNYLDNCFTIPTEDLNIWELKNQIEKIINSCEE